MTDLLHSLHAASEPSRELDAEIHAWVLQKPLKPESFGKRWVVATVGGELVKIPHYTSNLQDALELVPGNTDDKTINWQIESAGARGFCAEVLVARAYDDWVHVNNLRPNPALALATAAIDAQMKLREDARMRR